MCYIDLGYVVFAAHIYHAVERPQKKNERGNVHKNHECVTVSTFTSSPEICKHMDLIESISPKAIHSNQFSGECFYQSSSNQHDITITINKLIADGDSVFSITQIPTLYRHNLHVYLYKIDPP